MNALDAILRGGIVVTHEGERMADVGVADGKIAAIEPSLTATTREEIDARDFHIFPGLIDSHVHFNDPGRAHWEGIETGSRALAAGGGTLFFDMPLNSSPPTLDAESFALKRAMAEKTSVTDFALWGGLTPSNLDAMEELAERGVVGFKAFMSNSGIEDFSCVDDGTLREGMKRAAKLGKLVAVHAESENITSELSRQAIAADRTSIRDYLNSRPVSAEVEAIERAIALSGETGCALHIVHVSSGSGVTAVVAAQQKGINVTCETCPHYLALTEEDVDKFGAMAKCAPPLRDNAVQGELWQAVQAGQVATIGSDHSPAPPDMKQDKNFFKVWGGISGVQHTLPLLVSSQKLAVSQIARLTSFNVAERFSLPKTKGRIEIGADADLALIDLKGKFSVSAEELFYRHKQSPYVGRALTGRVIRTILRGQTSFRDGRVTSPSRGRFVEPKRRQDIK
jgi:allantoinase